MRHLRRGFAATPAPPRRGRGGRASLRSSRAEASSAVTLKTVRLRGREAKTGSSLAPSPSRVEANIPSEAAVPDPHRAAPPRVVAQVRGEREQPQRRLEVHRLVNQHTDASLIHSPHRRLEVPPPRRRARRAESSACAAPSRASRAPRGGAAPAPPFAPRMASRAPAGDMPWTRRGRAPPEEGAGHAPRGKV